jgi:hypothetical protein
MASSRKCEVYLLIRIIYFELDCRMSHFPKLISKTFKIRRIFGKHNFHKLNQLKNKNWIRFNLGSICTRGYAVLGIIKRGVLLKTFIAKMNVSTKWNHFYES